MRGVRLVNEEAARDLRAVLAAPVGVETGPDVPMIAPAMLLGAPKIRELTHAMTPPEGLGVVHEAQVFQRAAPIYPEGCPEIWISGEAAAMSARFDFEIQSGDAALARMQTRLRFVSFEEMAAIQGTSFSSRFETSQTVWHVTGAIGAEEVLSYLALSHDGNPIHSDDNAARAVGLPGAVLPGMMLCGVCEYALVQAWPGIWVREMKARFMASVPVGASVRFAMVPRKTDADGFVQMARVFAVTSEDIIAAIMDVQTEPVIN
ncbi:Acyl dehydratase [Shimia aestuarii]|uniref:Acyl dehydratase n=1 Tax=Shimia aestuarii TaxID=254406 RepID=A0A1I4S1P1_9RHOB|nr:Acyl dehydratase [Shimia aestuarii]